MSHTIMSTLRGIKHMYLLEFVLQTVRQVRQYLQLCWGVGGKLKSLFALRQMEDDLHLT